MPWMPAGRMARVAGVTVALVLGALVAAAAIRFWRIEAAKPSPPIVSTHHVDSPASIGANPGYMGPEVCARCHPARVEEFKSTRHFLATCVPDPERMPIGFSFGHGTFVAPDAPIRFEMSCEKDAFIQTTWRHAESGQQKITSAISLIYGSKGGNDEVYFAWHGDHLRELPMVWLGPEEVWGTSPYDRHGSGDFSRDMTVRCVECHNTWVEHVPGSRSQYSHDQMILGVTCEVCHGPGSEHVDFHEKFPQVTEPHAIARPATLPRERLLDLCAQCHSNALKHRGPAFRYRPGEPLEDYYHTIRPRYPEDDHVANQTTYLRQSRCFQESDTLTCVSCHNPHQPRSDTNAGAASCRQCHKPADCSDRDRLPIGVREDCVDCHMPLGRKIQVNFMTQVDSYVAPVPKYEHRIAVYPDARMEVLLRWYRTQSDAASEQEVERLSKSLAQIRRQESDDRRREFRFLAAIDGCREAFRFDPNPETKQKLDELIAIQNEIDTNLQDGLWHDTERRSSQAIEAFQRVLAAKSDHAMAHGKLGTNYAVVGQSELAVKHLKMAAEIDPDDPYPTAMLGWMAYLDGRAEEALGYFQKADEVEPYSAKINHQMGLAYVRLGRFTEAVERFSKAVTVDPKATSSMVALSQTLRRQGKHDEAVRYGMKAVQVSGSREPDILINLADCYADQGKWSDAIQAAENALKLVPPQQSKTVSQVRLRLQELRTRAKSSR